MKHNRGAPKAWPTDYAQWRGDFESLVHTTGEVLRTLDPQTKPPSISLMRHYQQIRAVGRGERLGRTAQFGFQDLAAAVATKGLVKSGVGLNLAASVLNSASNQAALETSWQEPSVAEKTVAELIAQAGSGSYRLTAPASVITKTPCPAAGFVLPQKISQATSYGVLRGRAMAGLGSATLHTAANGGLADCSTFSMSLQGEANPLIDPVAPPMPVSDGQPLRGLYPAPWLRVYLDDAGADGAPREETEAVADALEALAARLRQGSS